MDYGKLFDLICHTADEGTGNSPYEMVNPETKSKILLKDETEKRQVIRQAIQAYFYKGGGSTLGEKNGNERMIIQAFGGSSDLPVITKDVFTVHNPKPTYDTAWQRAFRAVQLSKGQLSWEIFDIEDGFGYRLIPEGGAVDYYGVTADKLTVDIQKYGMGILLTWEMIEGRKLTQFIQLMEKRRAKLYRLWADIHYSLLMLSAESAGRILTFQGESTLPNVNRVIKTINEGYLRISDDCAELDYGDTANIDMLLYAQTSLKADLNAAMTATTGDLISSGAGPGVTVNFNVEPLYTKNPALNPSATYPGVRRALLVLPGEKIQNAAYLQELSSKRKDQDTLAELEAHWTAFGGAVGEPKQLYILEFDDRP